MVEPETVSKTQRVENKFPELPLDYLERVDKTSKNPKKITKLKNIFIWIGVLSFFVIIAWSLSRNFNVKNISEPTNQTTTTVLIKTTTTTVYNIEDICLSQVNENLKIAKSKMPSETKVSVINVKKFMGGENVTQWVQIYFLSPVWGGLTCESFWAEKFSPCKDYETLKMISETLSPKRVVGVGVAIKKEAVEMGTYYSTVFPVFCDDSGNLMPNSKNFLLTELR